MNKGFITGYKSNLKIEIFSPKKESIHIHDISHALSRLCRFNGHCSGFYSVLQHSTHVSYLCQPEYALEGLLHDATEAYCGDLIRPIKYFLPEFKRVEDKFEHVIREAFFLSDNEECWKNIKKCDNIALVTEARDFVDKPLDFYGDEIADSVKLKQLSMIEAEHQFQLRYKELAWQRAQALNLDLSRYTEALFVPRLNI